MILRVDTPPYLSNFEKEFCRKWLLQDKPIIFPTDTVMGIGVHGESHQAVCNLFSLKMRDENKPLILFLDDVKKAHQYVSNPLLLQHPLLKDNWPGTVTGVFPMKQCALYTTPQKMYDTIGIRVPSDPYLLDFLSDLDFPLLTTSANSRDEQPFASPLEAQQKMGANALILDLQREETEACQPSAVISFTEPDQYKILREGVIRGS
jgi:L-threonylcarbamoyladenylate synthase